MAKTHHVPVSLARDLKPPVKVVPQHINCLDQQRHLNFERTFPGFGSSPALVIMTKELMVSAKLNPFAIARTAHLLWEC